MTSEPATGMPQPADLGLLFEQADDHDRVVAKWLARQLNKPPVEQLVELRDYITDQIQSGKHPALFRAPLGCQLELTHFCNQRCIHCYNRSGPSLKAGYSPRDIDFRHWLTVASELGKAGLFECIISGGEPLLLGERLFDLMDILHDHGAIFILITNGSLLTERYAKKLTKYRFSWLQVSIDGHSPHIHDYIRQTPGSWQRAVTAANLIYHAGIPLGIAHVVMRPNFKYLEEMADFAYALGAIRFVAEYFLPTGRAADNFSELSVDTKGISQMFESLERKQQEYAEYMIVKASVDPALYLRMRQVEPSAVLLVRPNGDVKIDCVVPFVLGNIKERSILDIWNDLGKNAWSNPLVSSYISDLKWGKLMQGATPRPYVDPDIRLINTSLSERHLPRALGYPKEITPKVVPEIKPPANLGNINTQWEVLFQLRSHSIPKPLPVINKRTEGEFLLVIPFLHPRHIVILNSVARFIYSVCDGSRSLAEIRDLLLRDFDVRSDVLYRDILYCLRHLEVRQLISFKDNVDECHYPTNTQPC